jgi:hypothetical protein
MPGIANISRYEHSVGTAYLSSRLGFFNRLAEQDKLVLQASALLHDFGITAYGHLVEEALQYVSLSFEHEMKLSMLVQNSENTELGGVDLQIYAGHQSGVTKWLERTFGTEARKRFNDIVDITAGRGMLGPCVSGDIDVDNLDNLVRIAFHMGLKVDTQLPVKIALGMVGTKEGEGIIFSHKSAEPIKEWLELRQNVYSRLMLSREDFTGKAMLICATVMAIQGGYLGVPEYIWTLTDRGLLQHLLDSKDKNIINAVESWLVGDLWPLSDLLWMAGDAPRYTTLKDFNVFISEALGRSCFSYRIRDKRTRLLNVHLESGDVIQLGTNPTTWVLGIVSQLRSDFTVAQKRTFRQLASEFFQVDCLGRVGEIDSGSLPFLRS